MDAWIWIQDRSQCMDIDAPDCENFKNLINNHGYRKINLIITKIDEYMNIINGLDRIIVLC